MLVFQEFGLELLYVVSGVMLIAIVYLMTQVENLKKQIRENNEREEE